MRAASALVVAALALVGCGGADYRIGQVTVRERDAVTVWPDLPEALFDMQQLTDAPDTTWDVELHLFPAGSWRLGPHIACSYNRRLELITARVTGWHVAGGCLAHEFAHRWVHVTDGWAAAAAHDDHWDARRVVLDEIVSDTWASR